MKTLMTIEENRVNMKIQNIKIYSMKAFCKASEELFKEICVEESRCEYFGALGVS